MTGYPAPTSKWDGAELDLPAYLARIGFTAAREPTLETLRALQYAHTTTIPFENVDAVLGHAVRLDLPALQDKLVGARRGGYCYENIVLFAAALERLGFGVIGLQGRVSMGAPRGTIRPATHALLRVGTADDERIWLCDVGFGAGPSAPLPLDPDAGETRTGDWRFRLERVRGELDSELWVLHQFARQGWIDRHSFTMNPQYRIDYAVGNHFVSTSPRSPFVARPFIQRFRPDRHDIIDDTTWITEYPDGTSHSRDLPPHDLPKILAAEFDIELDDADAARLAAGEWRTR
ncbi:arylamine N-acetyltransferase [Nocardia sp. NPDC052254]|uniref:arylamine N-acetyltransferase family protein n=1 Tax=Nocardia sp. NPDC052254 TaxID=3155681 RepID=UPI0034351118